MREGQHALRATDGPAEEHLDPAETDEVPARPVVNPLSARGRHCAGLCCDGWLRVETRTGASRATNRKGSDASFTEHYHGERHGNLDEPSRHPAHEPDARVD